MSNIDFFSKFIKEEQLKEAEYKPASKTLQESYKEMDDESFYKKMNSELPRLMSVYQNDLKPENKESLLGKLRNQNAAERKRGLAGHWTYDKARHANLKLYHDELERRISAEKAKNKTNK